MLTEETVFCQPSWIMQSNVVRMAVTKVGAHAAPVYFDLANALPVQPYHISPWQCEEHAYLDGRPEGPLRGDFFCLPFGKADAEDGTPAHGRTASAPWTLGGHQSVNGVQELSIHMENALHSAGVARQYFLRDGENVIYDRATITGLDGAYTLGHHPVLRLPSEDSALLVSTSKIAFGLTYPGLFSDPANAEYQSLAMGAEFSDLKSVPSIFKGVPDADCSRYPARRGFADLIQVGIERVKGQPAWTAAVNSKEGYLWFAMRDPEILPSTLLWIENGGRHQPPWSGRNCCLGVEDVCAFFDTGSKVSGAPNAFSERGIKTVHQFKKNLPLSISYLQGVVRTPPGFAHVRSVRCQDQAATFADAAGHEVSTKSRSGFVFGERL